MIDNQTLLFPAITFCLLDNSQRPVVSHNLSRIFTECVFESIDNNCTLDDFEYSPIYDPLYDTFWHCNKYNGGRNSENQEIDLMRSKFSGSNSGLFINFNISKGNILLYYVGDNNVKPISTELDTAVELNQNQGKYYYYLLFISNLHLGGDDYIV